MTKKKRDKRTQAKNLDAGDQLKLKDNSGRLLVTELMQKDDELVRLSVKFVPCSGECAPGCECLYQRFAQHNNPLPLHLKPSDWVTYYGNLASINQKIEELQRQVELLEATQQTEETPQLEEQPIA